MFVEEERPKKRKSDLYRKRTALCRLSVEGSNSQKKRRSSPAPREKGRKGLYMQKKGGCFCPVRKGSHVQSLAREVIKHRMEDERDRIIWRGKKLQFTHLKAYVDNRKGRTPERGRLFLKQRRKILRWGDPFLSLWKKGLLRIETPLQRNAGLRGVEENIQKGRKHPYKWEGNTPGGTG